MPRGPLTVLHFSNSTERGGAEEHMLTLLGGLDRRRFRCLVACLPKMIQRLRPDMPEDIELIPIDLRKPWRLRGAVDLWKLLSRRRVDILHSHMFYASLFASPVGRTAGVPVIVETPHLREHWRHGPIKGRYFIDRFVGRAVTQYIAVSESNARYLAEVKRIPEYKIAVIQNGSDLSRFSNQQARPGLKDSLRFAAGDPVLLVAARLAPQKGHRILLDAMQLVLARHPAAKLVCVGDGELRAELERTSRAMGLETAVRWVGYQRNMPDWLALADLSVLPSFFEGLPLFAIESLACGVPMVATAVDGTPEVVVDGKTGFTVPPGDSPALAEAICRLLGDAELRRRLGAQGKSWVAERFDRERQIACTGDLYSRLWQASHEAVKAKTVELAHGGRT